MAKFKTLRAIATSYGRVPKGAVIELSKDEAKRYGERWIEKTDEDVTDEKYLNSVNGDPTATQTLSGDAESSNSNDDSQDDENDSDDDSDGLDDLSAADLKAKAAELELPTSGSKSALIERIRLAQAADSDDSDDSTDDE